MEEKFTNQELYNWKVDQISSFYYQSYQLAHDLAKQCERAYPQELVIRQQLTWGIIYNDLVIHLSTDATEEAHRRFV